ncbi:uncharacterized protein EAF02_004721 [Botrytis sinoallii]|uniref:uncharacterized protein n=1 Tax=Botrytis sinoallii TaxID=1463999 RepID=UPI001900825A|nr:uncharacterized protein EAF02_004721 [Botrytis sinoallii]KAF7884385.1 hypothetical protein EAF02_004721 [Botrytis sinoallii]
MSLQPTNIFNNNNNNHHTFSLCDEVFYFHYDLVFFYLTSSFAITFYKLPQTFNSKGTLHNYVSRCFPTKYIMII